MSDWVKAGDRVKVYQRPFTNEDLEGMGTVVDVNRLWEDHAHVDVEFDADDGEWGAYGRTITPDHVVRMSMRGKS